MTSPIHYEPAPPPKALPKPNLTPRRGILWTSLGVFAVWVGLLGWVYVTQILMTQHK